MSQPERKPDRIGQNVQLCSDTILGSGVRLGNNVTCYPGVEIGDGCTIMDGAVIGRPPIATGGLTRSVDSSYRRLVIGAGCVIGANTVLYTGIQLGDEVLIGDLASIREDCIIDHQAVVGRGVLVMYQARIGERSRVIDGATLTGQMIIEGDVFIGPGVNSINDNDVYLRRFGLQPFEVSGPTVRRFALIGASAVLAAGIEIGMGAIVAPGAIVTKDVPSWSVVMGIPAKVVREVPQEQRDLILRRFGLQESSS